MCHDSASHREADTKLSTDLPTDLQSPIGPPPARPPWAMTSWSTTFEISAIHQASRLTPGKANAWSDRHLAGSPHLDAIHLSCRRNRLRNPAL